MNKVLLSLVMLLPGLVLGVGTVGASDEPMATVELRDNGEIRIEEGLVKAVDSTMMEFIVKADSAKFTVHIMPGADFRIDGEDAATLAGVMKGARAEVRGTLDPMAMHTIHADRVRIETDLANLDSGSGSASLASLAGDKKVELKVDAEEFKLDVKAELEELDAKDDNSGKGNAD